MTSRSWARLDELFAQAIERPSDERAAFVEAECADDEELLRELRRLLAAADTGAQHNVLEQVVASAAASALKEDEVAATGREIGPYRVLREIGAGGMGTVYLAERADEEYDKQVAIKLLRASTNPELQARFRAERQILATLEHPNIARLLDGGATEDGTPYVVMEHVGGDPIDIYCREEGLTTQERLRLFSSVCTAVQHAHRNLVVHRDIKPGNILVDDDGTPKLLDFGIAKLLDASIVNQPSTVTRTGSSLLTPRYASPEQIRGRPITTASDVYSLGVLLFELLTGRSPYQVETRDPLELAEAVCEREPTLPSVAAAEADGPNPAGLARQLEGDLDNILLKALRKEPAQRYGSPEELADDLRRHMDGMPVSARPSTWRYRVGKYARRHQMGLSAAAIVVALLGTAAVFSASQMRSAVEAGAVADRERSVATSQARRALLAAASTRIEAEDPMTGERLLQSVALSERGWEWAYLWNEIDRTSARVSANEAVAAGMVRDRAEIVTVSASGAVQWWSSVAEEAHTVSQIPVNGISRAAFAMDGTRVAIVYGESARRVALWEVAPDTRPTLVFDDAVGGSVLDLVTSAAGADVVATTSVATWYWRDGRSGALRFPHGSDGNIGTTLAIAAAGDVAALVVVEGAGSYRLLDPTAPALADAPLGRDIIALAVSPDGSVTASGETDRVVRVRDVRSGRVLGRLNGHTVPPDVVAFSLDGRFLATGAPGDAVRVWDIANQAQIAALRGPERVTSLTFNREGQRLLAFSGEGDAWMWERNGGSYRATPNSYPGRSVASTTAGHAVTLSSDGELRLIDGPTGQLFDAINLARTGFEAIAASRDGSRFVTLREGVATVRPAVDPTQGATLNTGDSRVISVTHAPASDLLATLDAAGGVTVWSGSPAVRTMTVRGAPSEGGHLAFSPDGTRLATSHVDGLRIWDVPNESLVRRIELNEGVSGSVAYGPDGAELASGWPDGSIRLWDVSTGRENHVFVPHAAGVHALAYSPNGSRLVSGASDGTLWLSEVETASPLLELRGHLAEVVSLAFSPDGSRLLSGDVASITRVWDALPRIERFRALAQLVEAGEPLVGTVAQLLEQSSDPTTVARQIREDESLTGRARVAALQFTLDPPPPPNDLEGDPHDGFAFESDSDDSYVLVGSPESLRMTPTFTLEAWIQPATPGRLRQVGTVINKEGEYQIALHHTGEVAWLVAGPQGWLQTGWIGTRYRIRPGTWAHVALVRDGPTFRFYINGRRVQTRTIPEQMGDHHRTMNEFRISGRQHTPLSFLGRMDDVRVWGVARSEAEIRSAMKSQVVGTEDGLLAAWSFDEGSGRVTRDLVGRYDGTLVGGRWSRTRR